MADKHVLLVEDNPDDEALTMRALKKAHILNPVVIVRDGAEAVEYVLCTGRYAHRDPTDTPQVILLDLKLPKVSGLDVLRRIKGHPRYKAIPIVMLTTSSEDTDVRTAYELGANSYIIKPVNFENFLDVATQLEIYWSVLNTPHVPAAP